MVKSSGVVRKRQEASVVSTCSRCILTLKPRLTRHNLKQTDVFMNLQTDSLDARRRQLLVCPSSFPMREVILTYEVLIPSEVRNFPSLSVLPEVPSLIPHTTWAYRLEAPSKSNTPRLRYSLQPLWLESREMLLVSQPMFCFCILAAVFECFEWFLLLGASARPFIVASMCGSWLRIE